MPVLSIGSCSKLQTELVHDKTRLYAAYTSLYPIKVPLNAQKYQRRPFYNSHPRYTEVNTIWERRENYAHYDNKAVQQVQKTAEFHFGFNRSCPLICSLRMSIMLSQVGCTFSKAAAVIWYRSKLITFGSLVLWKTVMIHVVFQQVILLYPSLTQPNFKFFGVVDRD